MHIVIDNRGRRSSSGRYADRLVEHLQSLDKTNRYTILLEPGDNWRPTAKNFTSKECGFKKFSFNPIDQITFAIFIRRLNADLVHFWMTPQEPVFYSGKRITTTHDLTMLRFTRPGRLPIFVHWARMAGYRWLMKTSHKKAAQIIVPTDFVRDDVALHFPDTKQKIVVTHEATEPPIQTKPEKLKSITQPFILHVGSPFPHKNINRLTESFSTLKKDLPDLQLVLAGKKEFYFQELEAGLQDHQYSKDIVIPGFVTDAQLRWLYENAEAYVLPSLSEGFGLPGLEAMVHGCPVVSSNATCLPEVYGDAAHYFDPEDVQDITKKISEVLEDKKLRKDLVIKGCAQVKKYSWRKMAEQTLAVYKKVLSDR